MKEILFFVLMMNDFLIYAVMFIYIKKLNKRILDLETKKHVD